MIYVWIALIVVDILIIAFVAMTCYISLRRKQNDIRTAKVKEGSPLEKMQNAVLDAQSFFKEHLGELLIIEANGVQLAARRYTQEKPIGRIVMFHGYRSVAEVDFSCAMDLYYSLGYELILVDQRAHSRSTGSWIGYGVLERYDCHSWLRYLNDEFGAIPTFLSGISMGTATILMALEFPLPQNVCGIIADCGFTSPKEIIAHVMRKNYHLPPALLLPPLSLFSKLLAGYYFGECSTVETISKATVPILFIHGKDDTFVPPEMTLRNYEACPTDKKLILVDGAGHGTSFLQDRPRVEQEIKAFFAKNNPTD